MDWQKTLSHYYRTIYSIFCVYSFGPTLVWLTSESQLSISDEQSVSVTERPNIIIESNSVQNRRSVKTMDSE